MLDDIKLLLGIEGEEKDKLLNLLTHTASRQVLNKLKFIDKNLQIVPDDIKHIVVELVIIRFNKIGSEGIVTENVDGYSATYSYDELSIFDAEIKDYIIEQTGKDPDEPIVRFL